MEKDSFQNGINHQGAGQLSAGSYQHYANDQGGGHLPGGSYQNVANYQGGGHLQPVPYQNDANQQGAVQSSAGSSQSFANDERAMPLQSGSFQNDVNDQGVQQLPIGSYQNDTNNQGTQLAQMSFGSNDVNNQATNLNLTEVNNEGVQGKRELYLNEDYNQEEQQPQTEQKPASALVEKIQQLGVTNVPQLSADSKIHCLTIVGQIEGHLTLPPQNKTTKYEHLIPQLVAIEQNPKIEGVLIILNTVGGDVEAGLAISEMLATISKPTVSIVLGGGHSIGVPIAVSCDYSFIAETATMTIHPVRLTGLVISVRRFQHQL